MQRPVVGNEHDIDNRSLILITGANQGGKSTFLRAIGLAQLMMQSGMFVGRNPLWPTFAPGFSPTTSARKTQR